MKGSKTARDLQARSCIGLIYFRFANRQMSMITPKKQEESGINPGSFCVYY